MAMGILGQLTNNAAVDEIVYTVPVGKVAVFNIFACSPSNGIVKINNVAIYSMIGQYPYTINAEFKGIIGIAGTTVKFNKCTGIVTGYEEDA